ncbi:MAG: LemA family protein [Candidatus Krumholzibacteria bacterium]|nr:LemA family protein [Candidatus Krumholzibacteria bacterium]MDH4335764.1 LemA family protein [Candidatus Krumholzibacteria bacterium]MDH5269290.1 LemA family protein [Candidatus Krumholzibacteria bacterium]
MGKLVGVGFGILVLFLVISGVSSYNALVKQSEAVDQAWSQVENVYQRRSDLIPNLVETVKGASNFEQETLTQVIEARARASQITVTPEMLSDPQALQRFDAAQGALGSALSRLLVTVEQYPELKANANYLALQDELAGTENRIAVERMRFTETVRSYNVAVKRFPTRLFAGMFGFTPRAYFEAREGAEEPPKVDFN